MRFTATAVAGTLMARPLAGDLEAADARMTARLDDQALHRTLALVPEELLMHAPEGHQPPFASAEANRDAYFRYLSKRLHGPRAMRGIVKASRRTPAVRPGDRNGGFPRLSGRVARGSWC